MKTSRFATEAIAQVFPCLRGRCPGDVGPGPVEHARPDWTMAIAPVAPAAHLR